MKLEDSIYIEAPPDQVYRFFDDMEAHYLEWHPQHLAFEWRKGKGLKEGNVFYFEEEINGEILKKETRFTQIIPDRYIAFTMFNWFFRWFIPKMTFVFEPESSGCRFTGQIFLRGIGPIGRWANRKGFRAVQQHMKEEGENLKKIIEQGL
jgi:hypothetical protein